MVRNLQKSELLFSEAEKHLVGGVNSPLKSLKDVGGKPVYMTKGDGCRVFDVDGNEYIDYVCSSGSMILGHANPEVAAAVCVAARNGISFGTSNELETIFARTIAEAVPSMQKMRMTSSRTESMITALRLARAYTRRDKVIKIIGAYHGNLDSFVAKSAVSGEWDKCRPDSPGIVKGMVQDTILVPYNNIIAIDEVLRKHTGNIAAIVIEPILASIGVIKPYKDYLKKLRDLSTENGIILIFDESDTGFRICYGGVQSLFGITPDMTILGKIIGAGFPIGVFGGREEIMALLSPAGTVFHHDQFSGNPVILAAGIQTLEILRRQGVYEHLEKISAKLEKSIENLFTRFGIEHKIQRMGSIISLFFCKAEIFDHLSALKSDTQKYAHYFQAFLERGIYFPSSQFSPLYTSLAHRDVDIDLTIMSIENSLTSHE